MRVENVKGAVWTEEKIIFSCLISAKSNMHTYKENGNVFPLTFIGVLH
jgi:hypothetical protein